MSKPSGVTPSEALTVNLNQYLLERLSRHCFHTELTKSQVVSIALKRFLAAEMATNPAFWEHYDTFIEKGKLSEL